MKAFFQASVGQALRNQGVEAAEDTVAYLTALLTDYARADRLFDHTVNGRTLLPLAELYRHAVEAASERERRLVLQRLGDVALFVAGLFSGWLGRRLVGVDYYVSMGGAAYGYLSEQAPGRTPVAVFAQLSRQFVRFADVLAEVGEQAGNHRDRDVLRLYQSWRQTGSPRAERALRAMGITPLPSAFAH